MESSRERALESKMHDLYANPSEYIPSEACETGMMYWSDSSQIGQVALCAGINRDGSTVAIGIAEQQGQLRLGSELHRDTPAGSHTGYWRPHIALPWAIQDADREIIAKGTSEYFTVGQGQACKRLFNLLLETEIEVTEDKISWLKGLPSSLKTTAAHILYLEENRASLAELEYLAESRISDSAHLVYAHAQSLSALTEHST